MMRGVILGDIVWSDSSFRVSRRFLIFRVFVVESIGLVTLDDRAKKTFGSSPALTNLIGLFLMWDVDGG